MPGQKHGPLRVVEHFRIDQLPRFIFRSTSITKGAVRRNTYFDDFEKLVDPPQEEFSDEVDLENRSRGRNRGKGLRARMTS